MDNKQWLKPPTSHCSCFVAIQITIFDIILGQPHLSANHFLVLLNFYANSHVQPSRDCGQQKYQHNDDHHRNYYYDNSDDDAHVGCNQHNDDHHSDHHVL